MKLEELQVQIIISKSAVQIRGKLPEFLVALECNVVGTDGEVVYSNFTTPMPMKHRVLLGTISSGSRGNFLTIQRNFDRHQYSAKQRFTVDKIRLYKGLATKRRKTKVESQSLKVLASAITLRIAPHYPKLFRQGQIEGFMDEIQKTFYITEVMES